MTIEAMAGVKRVDVGYQITDAGIAVG